MSKQPSAKNARNSKKPSMPGQGKESQESCRSSRQVQGKQSSGRQYSNRVKNLSEKNRSKTKSYRIAKGKNSSRQGNYSSQQQQEDVKVASLQLDGVGSIGWKVIHTYFSKYGKVAFARVNTDKKTGKPAGTAVVNFSHPISRNVFNKKHRIKGREIIL